MLVSPGLLFHPIGNAAAAPCPYAKCLPRVGGKLAVLIVAEQGGGTLGALGEGLLHVPQGVQRADQRGAQAVFRRVALEGESPADVGREFKLKPNAVYQIRNRILRAVREELDRFGRGRLSASDLLATLEEADAEVESLKSKV